MKLDCGKVMAVLGAVLSIAATIITKQADDKQLKETVAKEVSKQLTSNK